MLIDLIGRHNVLSSFGKINPFWTTRNIVVSDTRVVVQPTITLSNFQSDLDVLFVPGGNHLAAMQDHAVLDILAGRGALANYAVSFCSGSIILERRVCGVYREFERRTTELKSPRGAKTVPVETIIDSFSGRIHTRELGTSMPRCKPRYGAPQPRRVG